MLHHSEGYLSEKRAFCAYFVQLAWSKKPELVDSIPEGRSLPYADVRPRKDPTKGPSQESLGRTDATIPESRCITPKAIYRKSGHFVSILCDLLGPSNWNH